MKRTIKTHAISRACTAAAILAAAILIAPAAQAFTIQDAGGPNGGSGAPDTHLFRIENGKLRYVHTLTHLLQANFRGRGAGGAGGRGAAGTGQGGAPPNTQP